MPFEWIVAIRYLREGRAQSLLILSGVAVGVAVIVFLSALINGLQVSLIDRTLGTQAHIVLRRPDEMPRPLLDRDGGVQVTGHVERPAQRLRSILQWQQMLAAVERTPGIVAATPTVSGAAFAKQGTANRSVLLRGVEPPGFLRIIDVGARMVAGRFDVAGPNAVIGRELADALGLNVGDKLRLSAADDRSDVFTVRGVFDIGNKDANERWVFVSLRSAQTLLDLAGGVSTIEAKVASLFDADYSAPRRRSARLFDVDAAAVEEFRDRDGEDAVLEIGPDGRRVNRVRQGEGPREAAVPALDAVEANVLGVAGPPLAPEGELAVLDLDLDVVAREAGDLGGDDVAVGGLVDVHQRHPSGLVGAGEAVDALVQRKQILQRVPAREGHRPS